MIVLVLAALILALGWAFDVPWRVRGAALGALWGFVVLAQLVLPQGNGLRDAMGGSVAPWLLLAGAVALVLAYRVVLLKLRERAQPEAEPEAKKPLFSETELDRYARHIVLREVGGPGQKRLKQAKVLVLGAGGLGAPALQYLAAAGVGTIGVIDDDVVENSNLQRQVIHTEDRIGMPKVFSAEVAMLAQNPHVAVKPYHRKFDAAIAQDLVAEYDIVLDGTDNFATRYLANEACAAVGKPLVSGALSQWEGQLSVFDPAHGAPCYRCVFPEEPAEGLAPSCAVAGVIGTLPGVVGAMMANEAIKIITGAGAALRGEMLIYDGLWAETRKMRVKRRDDCPVCGTRG